MSIITLIPGEVKIEQLLDFADNDRAKVCVDRAFKIKVDKAAEIVNTVVTGEPAVYGVNTGFGKLANVRIPSEDSASLQRNLILSHCAGVGDISEVAIVRLMMVLKLISLGRGASGVRWALIESIENLLNHGITPAIPSQGSVGASGDLAPLAHFAAVLMGEGDAIYKDEMLPATKALELAGLSPIKLIAKEGLALINGTQFCTAAALIALGNSWQLAHNAIIGGAMTTDAIMGSTAPLRPEIHQLRGHQGQIDVAASMRALMDGSQIRESHREDDTRVQDPYCIRCQPQVTGACLELLRQAAASLQVEANAVTDNPLVIDDADNPTDTGIYSGGNFHAEPVAFAADQIALAIAEIGAIAQRRIALMVDPVLSYDLPPFLTPHPGLSSGFMVAEITSAALMSENKHLANPCSTDSTPTSANQEDHVSMAAHGAVRLARMNKNLANILAIELLCSARGVEFREPLVTSKPLQSVINTLRKHVSKLENDRYIATDLKTTCELIHNNTITRACLDIPMPALNLT